MNLTSIPALQDNYIWTLNNEAGQCLIVDPGEAAPVLKALDENQWQPVAILLTHHHGDHVDGVKKLREKFPGLVVYGPNETQDKGATEIVTEGDTLTLLDRNFTILHTPGHTLGHISYFSFPYLFCGDTMFSGGCGRLFEGTTEQMFESFQKINQLPEETLICCAHEYTLSNLTFSNAIFPNDVEIARYYHEIKELRVKKQVTLPTKLALERRINVFLRTQEDDLQKIIGFETSPQHEYQVFATLREKKDNF
ncbi:hydroxyacylglutathione hydrolase [Erwinia oleae]|uniref:hydroxyacylglutathione hydrolase n=1 Tax=Erwinia oleae TaxID=796334 RepID=UPI0005522D35|nr:hydroxyacylglutathione hydrolase [Erwinia oleae]